MSTANECDLCSEEYGLCPTHEREEYRRYYDRISRDATSDNVVKLNEWRAWKREREDV